MKKILVNDKNNVNKVYAILGGICIASIVFVLVYLLSTNTKQTLVKNGKIETVELTTGFIIKNEKTIEKDASKVLVPVIAEGSRVSKSSIIATYKGTEYTNYEEKLKEMDKEILERMKELQVSYSSEVDAIDNSINEIIKQSTEETSYSKMQEYKQKINNLINKRAIIVGNLSPEGAEVRQLIEKRNEYEKSAKNSNDNIIAPIGGIVIYNTDGLENKLTINNVLNIEYNKIKEEVNNKTVTNKELKVVNNYEAYIVVKVGLDNIKYITEDKKYTLRFAEGTDFEYTALLEKASKKEDGVEVYFKVTNGIEQIADIRQAEIEIVWDSYEGMIIPNETLVKDENKDIFYVTAIKYAEYEKIPVVVKIQNDDYSIIRNYTDEELEELGIKVDYLIKLYDRLLINNGGNI